MVEVIDLSQKSHKKPEGNTKPSGRNNEIQRYCFGPCTLGTEFCSISQLSQVLNDIAKKWYCQTEVGKITGFEHFQFCFSLKKKEYWKAVKCMLPSETHWEATEDWMKAIVYCTKKDTRIEGPWTEKSTFMKDPLEGLTMYYWEDALIKLILNYKNDRNLYWNWEPIGGIGKSEFCKHLYMRFLGDICIVAGNQNDMKNAIIGHKEHYGTPPKYVIIDIPRDQGNHIDYSGIEEVKNGFFYSPKYKGCAHFQDRPLVIIFANRPPRYDGVSADRWIVHEIQS